MKSDMVGWLRFELTPFSRMVSTFPVGPRLDPLYRRAGRMGGHIRLALCLASP